MYSRKMIRLGVREKHVSSSQAEMEHNIIKLEVGKEKLISLSSQGGG